MFSVKQTTLFVTFWPQPWCQTAFQVSLPNYVLRLSENIEEINSMALSYHQQEEMHTRSQKANVRSCGHHQESVQNI